MAAIEIDFEWWKCRTGYELVREAWRGGDDGLVHHPTGIRVLPRHVMEKAAYLVRRPGPLAPYRPLDKFAGLARIFASDVKKPSDVVSFVKRFGPLTREGLHPDMGECIDETIIHAEAMHELLATAAQSKRLVEMQANPLSNIEAALVLDPLSGRTRLQLKPSSLRDALWLQLAQALSGDAPLRLCAHCGVWFEVGRHTGRRLDAKFCSDEHRITFNSLKRTKKER
jgi:hypothetical protein